MARTVETLVDFADGEPSSARFLMAESMAGGASALGVRDRALARTATTVERFQRGTSGEEDLPDIDARVLLGTVCRLLATRLRRGETTLSKLTDDLLAWLDSYGRPREHCRWRTLAPGPRPAHPPQMPALPTEQPPGLLPSGRPRLPAQEIAENHRLRILGAAARLAQQKGYPATTIADITRLARIEGAVFYRHFSDKQEVFSAVHELGFQQVMDVTAKAFFTAADWPLRSWEAVRALTQLLQENPLAAHVGLVEAHAVGPPAVQRIEDSRLAFMFFLQEGLLQQPERPPPSRIAMEAIVAASFEILYLAIRRPGKLQIAGMLAPIAHIWLTPFLGAEQADAFIDAQTRAEDASKRPRKRRA
jgi:AcrR family transcriptional regulator